MDSALSYMGSDMLLLDLDIEPETNNNFHEVFKQYERVIIESIASAFLLDTILIADRVGGNVDTIHNVRNSEVGYKNKENKKSYNNRGQYNANKYHSHENYIAKNRENKELIQKGKLRDSYTGRIVRKDARIDLDHTIAAKEIHDDPGRVLAEISGPDIANMESNLNGTDMTINRSKKQDSANDFIERVEGNSKRMEELRKKSDRTVNESKELKKLEKMDKLDKDKLREKDKKAREEYELKISKEYYSSKKFWKDNLSSSVKVGTSVAIRQGLGVIFTEVWIVMREDFERLKIQSNRELILRDYISSTGESFKKAIKSVSDKFGDILKSISEGFIIGILSDMTNTIINIFTTSAKLAGKILRNTWTSIVEAIKILIFNKDDLGYGDQIKAVSKIIFTSISITIGTLVQSSIRQMIAVPVIKDIVSIFLGSLVTGLLSVSLLYYMDNSSKVQSLVNFCNNKFRGAGEVLEDFIEVNEEINRYAAELASIDYEKFEQEIENIHNINNLIYNTTDIYELNNALTEIINSKGLNLAYSNMEEMDKFMKDSDTKLIF